MTLDPDRFLAAQADTIETAQRELRAGRKQSHWMWFVFPQLRALGRSPTALHYGLDALKDARAYLAHPVLGPRLLDCAALVLAAPGPSAEAIMGGIDALKLRSCMTLFAAAAPGEPVFAAVLDRFFGGEPDPLTTALLAKG
jgi:uncharacterized protein (DUF1810 family)